MTHHVPFNNAYWVLPGRFLAGPYPGDHASIVSDEKLQGLAQSGVRCVINLMEGNESDLFGNKFEPYFEKLTSFVGPGNTIRWMRIPIRDMDIPTRQEMVKILDEIDKAISDGMTVYVHCLGGIGRTGTVVGCFLARHGMAEGEDALNMIAQLRQENENADIPSPQSKVQRDMVRRWRNGE